MAEAQQLKFAVASLLDCETDSKKSNLSPPPCRNSSSDLFETLQSLIRDGCLNQAQLYGPSHPVPKKTDLKRAVFTETQRMSLESAFQKHAYISKNDRKTLARRLGLQETQVKIWFQNRRMKSRQEKTLFTKGL